MNNSFKIFNEWANNNNRAKIKTLTRCQKNTTKIRSNFICQEF